MGGEAQEGVEHQAGGHVVVLRQLLGRHARSLRAKRHAVAQALDHHPGHTTRNDLNFMLALTKSQTMDWLFNYSVNPLVRLPETTATRKRLIGVSDYCFQNKGPCCVGQMKSRPLHQLLNIIV